MEESLFEKIGGEAGVSKVVEEYFKRVLDDPRVRNRFNGVDIDSSKRNYTNFISNLLKTSSPYTSGALSENHRTRNITKHEFDLALSFFEDVLKEQGFSSLATQQFIDLLASVRVDVEGI